MTIQNLIKILDSIPNQDTIQVMIPGYEGGYDNIKNITPQIQSIALNVNSEWYMGSHEYTTNLSADQVDKFDIVKAIVLRST